jgi:uncharacterized damage-inducible protein DinB
MSQETRAEEVARVRGYIVSQARKRTPAQIVEALKEAHAQLVQSCRSISQENFVTAPVPGEWSAAQVLAHVLDVAEYDNKTIIPVLQTGNSVVESTPLEDTHQVNDREEALAELEQLREALIVAALSADPEANLDLVAWIHHEFGSLNWREALLFARVHTLDHARQITGIAEHYAGGLKAESQE